VVGTARFEQIIDGDEKKLFIGEKAIEKRGILTLEYPLQNGIVTNWDYMEKIWEHTYFDQLKVNPEEQPVLLTEAALNPKQNREQMVEIFFDKFKVPGFYVFTQAVLALYASGRTTGLVCDSGDGVTHIVVVYDGYSIKHAVKRLNVAGRDLTDYMQKYLSEDGYGFSTSAEKEIARTIKETLCRVSLNFDEEMEEFVKNPDKKQEFELPDGTKIKVGNLSIRTPECLFKPSMLGLDVPGIHKAIHECIQKTDIDLRRDLYENITLSGGSTMFEGMQERLTKEIQALVPESVKVKIIAPVERKFTIWIGGSVLSTLATFQSSWITAEEYQEHGPSIVHRKCY
jgi:actin